MLYFTMISARSPNKRKAHPDNTAVLSSDTSIIIITTKESFSSKKATVQVNYQIQWLTCLVEHKVTWRRNVHIIPNNSNTTTGSFRVVSAQRLPRRYNTDLHCNTSCSSIHPMPCWYKDVDINYDVINWCIVLSRVLVSMVIIDSKDADFVHVWELSNHQDDHCKCVQEKHWILVVSRVRSYQVPARRVKENVRQGRIHAFLY